MARKKKGTVHGWVVLDKPYGMTSTQAVGAMKRIFGTPKAGHAGTLAVYGALMIGCASAAVWCEIVAPQWGPAALAAACAGHVLLFAAIDYHWRRSAPTT